MKKLLVSSFLVLSVSANAANVTLVAEPHETACFVDTSCNAAATHSVSIQNTTNVLQTYHVMYQVCADNNDCKRHIYDVPIAPTHVWKHEMLINLFTSFKRARIHNFTAVTQVMGSDYANQLVKTANIRVN